VVTVFISADGETMFLQDRALKYNDFMASMGATSASIPHSGQ